MHEKVCLTKLDNMVRFIIRFDFIYNKYNLYLILLEDIIGNLVRESVTLYPVFLRVALASLIRISQIFTFFGLFSIKFENLGHGRFPD